MGIKIRCPCGSSLLTDSMIKCKDLQCHIWQHVACVIIPEQPLEGAPPGVPDQFYCETCRLKRADPFGVSVVHPLYPVKLAPPLPTEGGNPVQNVEKTFKLTRGDKNILQKNDCDLQAWCILLNDKVPFRMHWPQYAGLQINGVPIRITNRPGSQLLGMNSRDDGPAITACSREGINKISISGCDARVFCVGVRIVKRLSVQEVLSLIPKETVGEIFEEALARVCRCIGGGNTADNADGDSDVEVVADSVTVNLRCPLSGSRMKIAGRFKPCVHMGCFDLETFVELSQRSRKWQCPICLKNYSLEHIIIDPYFSRITSLMRGCGEDVNEIEVKSDGSWRSKNISEHMDLSQWHYPDGSLCAATEVDMECGSKLLKRIKGIECNGNTTLNLGMKTNYSGIGGVSKLEEMLPVSSGENFENNWKKAVSLSSKPTGCIKNAEDANVNQGDGGPSAFSFNYGDELDSFSLNFNSAYCAADRVPPAAAEAALMYPDVIVISDSEEDIVHLISPEAVHEIGPSEGNEIPFSVPPHGVTDLFPEDPGFSASGSSCLGLSNYSEDDFGMPVWRLPPSPEAGHAFQLFDTNAVVQSTSVDVQRTSAPLDNNVVVTDPRLGSGLQVLGSSICHLNAEMTGGLIDNHLAFAHDDPSFQIYLSSCQAGRARQTDLSNNTDVSATGCSEDWISLRLGGRESHRESTSSVNEMKLPQKFTSNDGRMDCLANAASLLLSTGRDRSSKTATNKRSCGGPFSHPRQPRSIRRRLCTSRWRFG